jgi:hypothetical protein
MPLGRFFLSTNIIKNVESYFLSSSNSGSEGIAFFGGRRGFLSFILVKEHIKLIMATPKFNKINSGEYQYFLSGYNFSTLRESKNI